MIMLSPHFNLDEFTNSEYAERHGIDNTPGLTELANLRMTAAGMELVRDALNDNPITITSGFRCLELNKAIGSSNKHSQHPKGQACDFKCPAFGNPLQIVTTLTKSGIKYDQLILEFWNGGNTGWVHISFAHNPRRQNLIIDKRGVRPFK
jgi:zinc D-Ala-D-Ala carboxypeptidase